MDMKAKTLRLVRMGVLSRYFGFRVVRIAPVSARFATLDFIWNIGRASAGRYRPV
jgi:hypothetical protein